MRYSISINESKVINRLKAVFIVLVVLIHTRAYTLKGYVNYGNGGIDLNVPDWLFNLEYVISAIIAHCAVPGFFIISAILLYRKDYLWKNNIIKKTKSLVIPWFVIIAFWIVLYAVMQKIPFAAPFFSNDSKLISKWGGYQYLDAFLGITGSPLVYPLWFVQNLFFLNVISKLLKKIIDLCPHICLILLLGIYFVPFDIPLFCLEKGSLLWFCVGYYIVKYDLHINDVKKMSISAVFILYAISIIVAFITRENFTNSAADFICIICGLLFFSRIAFEMQTNRVIDAISMYSFIIFLLHEMWLRMILKAVAKILGVSVPIQLIQYFIVPIVLICLITFVSAFCKKYISPVYYLLNGGR